MALTLSFDVALRAPPDAGTIGGSMRRPPRPGTLADVDLAALLGTPTPGACPVAGTSRLYLRLPGALLLSAEQQQQQWALQLPPLAAAEGDDGRPHRAAEWSTPAFRLQPAPDAVAVSGEPGGVAQHVLYAWDLATPTSSSSGSSSDGAEPPDDGAPPAPVPFSLSWQQPAPAGGAAALPPGWRPAGGEGPVFAVSRYITGTGNLHGGMVLRLEAVDVAGSGGGGNVSVCVFQVVPWYVRLWLHTLELRLDDQVSAQRVQQLRWGPAPPVVSEAGRPAQRRGVAAARCRA